MSTVPSRYRRRADPDERQYAQYPEQVPLPPHQQALHQQQHILKPPTGKYTPHFRGRPPPGPPKLRQQLPAVAPNPAPTQFSQGQSNKRNFSPTHFAPALSPGLSPVQSPVHSPVPSTTSNEQRLKPRTSGLRIEITEPEIVSVRVRLLSREVVKHVRADCTAVQFADAIVREHRLELDADVAEASDDAATIVWEHIDGTRRPLRTSEVIGRICARWDREGTPAGTAPDAFYLRITGTALRDRVDSVASLVPRRDMLRQSPEYSDGDIHFFVARLRQRSSAWNSGGAIVLSNGVLACRKGSSVACRMNAADTDVYEWPHIGPAKYVLVLRNRSKALFLSTDSAKTFSVVRNAIYTARTQALFGRSSTSPSA